MMNKKKEPTVELRYYDVPQGESALALLGEKWVRMYGNDVNNLHFHNLYEIGYCIRGRGIMSLEDERMEYDTDTLTAIPPNYPHTTISENVDSWEYLFVDFESVVADMFPGDPAGQRERISMINSRATFIRGGEAKELKELVRKILDEFRNKDSDYVRMTQCLLSVFALELYRMAEKETAGKVPRYEGRKGFEQIFGALRYIDTHYNEDIKAADLAAQCCMSEVHLRRLFCEYVNLPPMDYVNLVRVQKARDLMQRTDYPMDMVASECGFASTSAFNRNFRKFTNNSPYQWKLGKENHKGRLLDYNILAVKGW
ncbi:MAG: AraC family transcriptional regulator [Lachnospiraceae bacterium]|nr:AraC family transcriptional regulator [Lachnospiraceae bacterium]